MVLIQTISRKALKANVNYLHLLFKLSSFDEENRRLNRPPRCVCLTPSTSHISAENYDFYGPYRPNLFRLHITSVPIRAH